MKRAVLFTSLAITLAMGPAAAWAQSQTPQQGQGQKKGSVSPQARQQAIEECRAIHGGHRRGADNTATRVEQCVNEKLGKK